MLDLLFIFTAFFWGILQQTDKICQHLKPTEINLLNSFQST